MLTVQIIMYMIMAIGGTAGLVITMLIYIGWLQRPITRILMTWCPHCRKSHKIVVFEKGSERVEEVAK